MVDSVVSDVNCVMVDDDDASCVYQAGRMFEWRDKTIGNVVSREVGFVILLICFCADSPLTTTRSTGCYYSCVGACHWVRGVYRQSAEVFILGMVLAAGFVVVCMISHSLGMEHSLSRGILIAVADALLKS